MLKTTCLAKVTLIMDSPCPFVAAAPYLFAYAPQPISDASLTRPSSFPGIPPKRKKDSQSIYGLAIVNPHKLGELQSVYNELRFYVDLASPCPNLLKFCLLIFH